MATLRQSRFLFGAVVLAGCGGGGGGPGPGPTPVITKTGGDNQIAPAGQALGALEVTVKDGSGNALPGITVNWTAASGGGSVNPPSSLTGADGKATTTRTLGPGAGTQTTTAGATGATAVTFSAVAQIQGATQITASGSATGPDSVLSTVQLSALVRDQNNLTIQGVIVTWTLTSGAGSLSQPTSTTGANGIAIDSLTVTQTAGPRTVQAAVPGLVGSPVTFTHVAKAGNATEMAYDAGDGQAGAVGTALPLEHRVIARDAYGNPKPGLTVTWVTGLGGGSVSNAAPVTSGTGIAAVTRTLGANAGLHSDTARVDSLTGSPVAFTDTAVSVVGINVGNNFFNPTPAAVANGSFVRFSWAGGSQHNVTWDGAPGALPTNSATQGTGTHTVRLTQPGTYTYHCTIHGSPGSGMAGTINVN